MNLEIRGSIDDMRLKDLIWMKDVTLPADRDSVESLQCPAEMQHKIELFQQIKQMRLDSISRQEIAISKRIMQIKREI